jgi:hypothetical protein
MMQYLFATHKNGTMIEGLGSAPLADDNDAFDLGRRVIQDLMRKDAQQYAGWTMNITEGERTVGSVLFDEG